MRHVLFPEGSEHMTRSGPPITRNLADSKAGWHMDRCSTSELKKVDRCVLAVV